LLVADGGNIGHADGLARSEYQSITECIVGSSSSGSFISIVVVDSHSVSEVKCLLSYIVDINGTEEVVLINSTASWGNFSIEVVGSVILGEAHSDLHETSFACNHVRSNGVFIVVS